MKRSSCSNVKLAEKFLCIFLKWGAMKVGVISVQGAALEHISASERALTDLGMEGKVFQVRKRQELEQADCVIIPGGESTTISKLLVRFDMYDLLVEMGRSGVPMLGTCAGCVLLAKGGDEEVAKTGTKLLGLMDMDVDRNAFGRQRESFEAPLNIAGLEGTFPGVFIRGPGDKAGVGRLQSAFRIWK